MNSLACFFHTDLVHCLSIEYCLWFAAVIFAHQHRIIYVEENLSFPIILVRAFRSLFINLWPQNSVKSKGIMAD